MIKVDNHKKIIFGWSAKCACSHVKKIFWFFQNGKTDNVIHTIKDIMPLPDNIKDYITILFIRNPYKRIVSGFLNKYNNSNGQYRNKWKYDTITFSMFVDELLNNNWTMIQQHHFTPQTSESFDQDKILLSKNILIYDIEKIDYELIGSLFGKKIPNELIEFKGGHARQTYNKVFKKNVYDLDIGYYYNYDVHIEKFFNEDIKKKVYLFYKNDFRIFKQIGFNYETFFENDTIDDTNSTNDNKTNLIDAT